MCIENGKFTNKKNFDHFLMFYIYIIDVNNSNIMHCKMIKLNTVIDCSSVNSCEKCGVLNVARHDDIIIDDSNCSKFYQNALYFTRIVSPFGYKQGGKRCCEGGLRIVSNASGTSLCWYFWSKILFEHNIKNIIFFNLVLTPEEIRKDATNVSTTEQINSVSQQLVVGTNHLPDYLLFGLGGISGFLFLATIVTILIFSVRRRNELQTKYGLSWKRHKTLILYDQ